jgi:hypothetical protein
MIINIVSVAGENCISLMNSEFRIQSSEFVKGGAA